MRRFRLAATFLRQIAIVCLLIAAAQLAVAATVIQRKAFDPEPFPLPDATVNAPLEYDVSHSCPANPSETNGYQWADPNAVPGLVFSPAGIISGTPTTAGTYVFSATILPSPSCEASNTGRFQLIVKQPAAPTGCTVTADGANPLVLNAPKRVALAAQCATGNPTSFAWSANAGLPSTAAGGAVQVNATQTFTVTPANASGNANAVSVTVTVPPLPSGCTVTADGANPLDLRAPKQVTLFAQCSAGDPTSFAWSANAGLPSAAAGGQIQVNTNQTFTVTPANASGAGATLSVTVNLLPPPAAPTGCTVTADGANPLNLGAPKQVTLSARCATGEPTTFAWSANAGLPASQASGQVQVNSTQTYTVTAANAGGPGNTASVTVTVGALTSSPAPGSNGQVGQANSPLPAPLVLQVNDLAGNPVAGVSVRWELTRGTGTLSAPVSLSNAQGQASVTLTLGAEAGPRAVRATAGNAAPVLFVVESAEQVIIAPTQQTATVQQLVALNAPRVQIANVHTRLYQLRQLRNPAVAQGLALTYDGKPLPWQLLAQAVAPTQSDAAPQASDPFERNSVYVMGDIEVGRQSNVGSAGGFDLRTKGLTLGADHRFDGNHVLGVALGGLRADTTLRDDGGTQDAKGYSLSAYGSYSFAENGYVTLIGNVGRNNYDGERNVAGGGTATSSTSGTQYGVALSAGYDFNRGGMSIGPYGRAEYLHARIDAYSESGTQALGVGEQTASATFLTLGGQANWAISASWGVFQPSVRLEWQYQSAGSGNFVSARLISQPGSEVSVQIAGQDRSYGLAAVGAQFILPHSVQAFVNFETPFGKSDYSGQRYTLGVRVGF